MTLTEEYYTHTLEKIDYGKTKNTVFEIISDFTGRRGLRQSWDDIDVDIQEEIIQSWIDIVSKNNEN